MTSDQIVTEGRVYADRIAFGLTRDPKEREAISKAAFLAYIRGFKQGLEHEKHTLEVFKRAVGHD